MVTIRFRRHKADIITNKCSIHVESIGMLVSCPRNSMYFVAIKMGAREAPGRAMLRLGRGSARAGVARGNHGSDGASPYHL
jgi:hypothetical protein